MRTAPTLLLTASNPAQLLTKLGGIVPRVPRRGDVRKAEQVEVYAVGCLLATLADTLGFPLSLVHRDRPDFQLAFPSRRISSVCAISAWPLNSRSSKTVLKTPS